MTYDVAVIGGGRAGAAAARMLAAGGRRTLLVDRPGRRRMGESLAPVVRTLLRELGAWDSFQTDGHLPCYGNESLWGSPAVHSTDFIRTPYGHGWHIDGALFDQGLRAGAEAAGAAVWADTSLAGLRRDGNSGWQVRLMRPRGKRQDVRARFVIDATGRGHRVAHSLGIGRRYDDRLLAFQALFRPDPSRRETDEDSLSFVESVARGWWYTARVPVNGGCQRTVVLFTDAGASWARTAATGAGFLALLETAPAIRKKLTRYGYTLAAGPVAVDARSSRLERLHGDGWLAVGDAAMAFDPLSSQGILTALYGGVKAANAVLAHLDGDADALASLENDLVAVYRHFQFNRERCYRLEKRWSDSPFWATRRRTDEG